MNTFPQHPSDDEDSKPHLLGGQQQTGKSPGKRLACWAGIGLLILIAVIVAAILALIHIPSLRKFALRVAEQKLSASFGARIQARDFALSLSQLTLDLYSVTVNGAAPYAEPPLVTVDHIGLGLGITSLLSRQWYVRTIVLDHPVVRLFVDARGNDNLPQSKEKNRQSNADFFQLGVRHALLDGGEVYYNNRKIALNADLHDLTLKARFDPVREQYSGGLSYRDGQLEFANYHPMAHELDMEFDATRSKFTLRHGVLRSGPSHLELAATVEDFAQPRMHATYSALVDSGEFRQIMKNPALPAGTIATEGTLDYQSQPDVPLLATMIVNGNLSSRTLRIQTSGLSANISDLGARYSLANGDAAVSDIHARLLGGNLTGNLTMRQITGHSHSRLRAALTAISLAELRPMMKGSPLQAAALTGTLNADADANWGKTLDDLTAQTNATMQARLAPRGSGGGQPVPVNGAIHAQYMAARKEVSLTQSYLRMPNTELDLNGTVSHRSSLEIRLRTNDLHELETVADNLRAAAQPGAAPQPLGLYGSASFAGAVSGSTSAPNLTGQLEASNWRIRGSAWRLLRTAINLSPSAATLHNGELEPADQGRITFNLSTDLQHWSFTDSSPFQLGLKANHVSVAELTQLAGFQAPLAGILSAEISLRGSELHPVGQGNLSLTKALIWSEPVESVNVNFRGTSDEVQAHLNAQIPAGGAQGVFAYFPKEERYQAQLAASGIRLAQLQTIKSRHLEVAGVLNITAGGQGSIKNPELSATVESPQLEVRKQTLGDLRLQTNLANHVADIALDTRAVNTTVTVRAQVNTTGDYQTNAKIDTQSIPLQPLIALYAPAEAANITGQTELHATLRGPLKDKSALGAHATIPIFELNYLNKIQLAAANPIQVDFTNGVLALQKTHIRGTDTDVELQASVPSNSAQPISLLALGTVNLQIAQLFDPDLSTSGKLRFDINSYGARANPDVHGQIRIENANFATADVPIGLQAGNGILTLTRDRLNITQFSGTIGGGKVQASGALVYKPHLRFDLALAGKGMRLLFPEGIRQELDANLNLSGTTEAARLGGRVNIDQLSFTPDFDLTEFISQFGGETAAPPTPGFSQNLELNVAVQSTTGVNLVSRELSLQGSGNLTVRGTADQPIILGRVNLTSGDLIFRGNRYILQHGTIDFANPARTQPTVNLAANTTIQQFNIYLQFYGPAEHLRTNYTSVPSLPPSDIISLLAFGRTTEASAANPTPGNLGAESLLASQVSSQLTSRVQKIAGISQLSIDPVLTSNGAQQNPGARVTIQQRVTANIFVTFATDLTQTQSQVVSLQYKLSPRVIISGTRDQNGGFSFDTRIRKSW